MNEKFNEVKHKKFKEMESDIASLQLEEEKEHALSCKQKVCLPYWCWTSFIHDKHEAFRYKYDVDAIVILEK